MFSVRLAEPADAMEVAVVHVRSWQHAYRGLFPDEYLDSLQAEDRAARYTFGGGAGQPLTIVALEDGAIRGFATIAAARGESNGKTAELLAMYVDPDRWGQGIGRHLMVEARSRLTELEFETAVLWCWQEMTGRSAFTALTDGCPTEPVARRRSGAWWQTNCDTDAPSEAVDARRHPARLSLPD